MYTEGVFIGVHLHECEPMSNVKFMSPVPTLDTPVAIPDMLWISSSEFSCHADQDKTLGLLIMLLVFGSRNKLEFSLRS